MPVGLGCQDLGVGKVHQCVGRICDKAPYWVLGVVDPVVNDSGQGDALVPPKVDWLVVVGGLLDPLLLPDPGPEVGFI